MARSKRKPKEQTIVLDAAAVVETVELDATAVHGEVVAELLGTITVRERLRALPWTGQRLRLCRTASSYRLLAYEPDGTASSWDLANDLRMKTEGLHATTRPSAVLELPSNAPAREHGTSASAPRPDEILLAGDGHALNVFLGKVREVVKLLRKQKPGGPLPEVKAAKRAKVDAPRSVIPSVRPAKAPAPRADPNEGKFMAPSLMEVKPGLGSGNGPSAHHRAKSGEAAARGGERGVPGRAAPSSSREEEPAAPSVAPTDSRSGLANLGNTCYLNAVLQGLSGCSCFVSRLEALSSRAPGADEDEPPLSARLLPLLQPGRAGLGAALLRQLKRAVSQQRAAFEGSAQHDAHELLCELLGRIEAEAAAAAVAPGGAEGEGGAAASAGASVACPVARSFGFELQTTLCCNECGHSSVSAEPFSHLSLSLPSARAAAAAPLSVEPPPRSDEAASSSPPLASPRSLNAILQVHAADAAANPLVRTPPRPPRPPRQRGRSLAAEAAWAQARAQEPDDEEAALAAAIAASLAPPEPTPPQRTVQQLLDRFLGEEPREWACSACGHGRAVARQTLLAPPEILLLHLSRFEAEQATGVAHKRHDAVTLDAALRLRHEAAAGEGAPPHGAAAAPASGYQLRAVVTHHGPRLFSGHYTCVERSGGGWTEYDDARVTPLEHDPTAHEEHRVGAYLLFYERVPG